MMKYDESRRAKEVTRRMKKSLKIPKGDSKEEEPPEAEELDVVWLMAYPFTGSSVALRNIQNLTGYSQGTNYGHIVDSKRGFVNGVYNSVPLNANSPNGPYKYNIDLPLPSSGYILTKTHCSGHCIDNGDDECILSDYVNPLINVREYMIGCASGTKWEYGREVKVHHNPWKAKKAVVLARHPVMVISARFLNEVEGRPNPLQQKWGREGILEWCANYDGQQGSKHLINFYVEDAKAMVKDGGVLCHAELYRIVNFYNQAYKLMKFMGDPLHVVRFEDYDLDFDNTLNTMAAFLELRMKESRRAEVPYQRYGDPDLFTSEEVTKMLEFFNIFASKDTKALFADYS